MHSSANPSQPPVESLGILLGLVKSELVRAMEAELNAQQLDLRFSQFQVLKRLHATGPMSAGELARSLNHDGGAMTRMLDQLEQRGFLSRQPHEQDRRALRIALTPSGKKLCRQLQGCSERVLDAAQGALGATERRQLNDYLQRVLDTLRSKND